MEEELQELKLKILVLGDSLVGKSSIILKYADNVFHENHLATIGVESKNKEIIKGKYKILLNLWDTGGQERFKAITKSFFNGANGIIFVYDITKKKSFEGIKSWMKDSEPYGNFKSILCANKLDLNSKREVKKEVLEEFALKNKINFFETSAKDGTNIDKVFDKLVSLILEDKNDEELIKEFGVKKGKNVVLSKKDNKKTRKNGCCKK